MDRFLDDETEELDLTDLDNDLVLFQQDDIVREALQKGVDLREYSTQIERDLRLSESVSVEEYFEHGNELGELHTQMQVCDAILDRMQQMLSHFQGDLGTISNQIKHLQSESLTMSVKLRNRTAAEGKLANFVSKVHVKPELAAKLATEPIVSSADYEAALNELSEKITYLHDPYVAATKSAREVTETVLKLRLRAIQRIREFLLSKFHDLKKHQTNIQIKQKVLLKSVSFYHFLLDKRSDEHRVGVDVATELRTSYCTMMGKLYLAKFKTYCANMRTLLVDKTITRVDTLAVDRKDTGGLFVAKRTEDELVRLFSLGDRHSVLQEVEKDYLIFHVEQKKNVKLTYERVFSSEHRLLVGSATSEYDFLREFFGVRADGPATSSSETKEEATEDGKQANGDADRLVNGDEIASMFGSIFEKTLELFSVQLDTFLETAYDCIGLLLMLRVLHQLSKALERDAVNCPSLDSFFDRVNIKLWTRFKFVWDIHVASLQNLKGSTVKKGEVVPHWVVFRYARFASALLTLNLHHHDSLITDNLRRLRTELTRFLVRCAANVQLPKMQIVFLMNNYAAILHMVKENPSLVDCDETAYFAEEFRTQLTLYVEQELGETFGRLIAFVEATESQLVKGGDSSSNVDAKLIDANVKAFASYWKEGIEQIASSVKQYFFFVSAYYPLEQQQDQQGEILKQVLVQLVLYYQRFQDILKRLGQPFNTHQKELVPIQTIMYEVKKYGKK